MKKFSTIIGVGMISMAVAFAPAFAQQTKSQEPTNSSATTVQPKVDNKAPVTAPAAKDEKGLPTKPGTGVKSESKAMPEKAGTETKSQNVPAKPGADVKAGEVQGKSEMGAKDEKAAAVKPAADVKAKHKAVKSSAKSTGKAAHTAKGPVKAGSSTDTKNQLEKSTDADAKPGSSNPARTSTGN